MYTISRIPDLIRVVVKGKGKGALPSFHATLQRCNVATWGWVWLGISDGGETKTKRKGGGSFELMKDSRGSWEREERVREREERVRERERKGEFGLITGLISEVKGPKRLN
ncbi:hypothetical protein H6P81_010155 [Aristolochia fimbriata]|uniref:Uncharacterized protein n=1 Tax=Aristolochia fimbriata TaxID=158543 RepID=A0AAV7EQ41_ARIFI|nr:hypothetical protein H6P81_010155 [Aristolochia fimbriata]